MKTQTYHLEFITPSFCAGADQAVAEVRPPSIRGKLRWWFRILGATREEENAVFGSVSGGSGQSSAITIRARLSEPRQPWQPVEFSGMSNKGYLLYFAKASANEARWNPKGALPAGTKLQLDIILRRRILNPDLFNLALEAFLLLGSLGLRSTRGLGCFETESHTFSEVVFYSLIGKIRERVPSFTAGLGQFSGGEEELLDGLGAQLRGLRVGCSAGAPGQSNSTPLGSSQPRQASAVYMRPVRNQDNKFRIVVFEAPAVKVLGPNSRATAPRLANGDIIPPPKNPKQQGGYGQAQRRY